jgi:hypothetical protein
MNFFISQNLCFDTGASWLTRKKINQLKTLKQKFSFSFSSSKVDEDASRRRQKICKIKEIKMNKKTSLFNLLLSVFLQ